MLCDTFTANKERERKRNHSKRLFCFALFYMVMYANRKCFSLVLLLQKKHVFVCVLLLLLFADFIRHNKFIAEVVDDNSMMMFLLSVESTHC